MTTKEIIAKTNEALKTFGTYSFDDKGPDEVMDIKSIIRSLKLKNPEEAASIILELSRDQTIEENRSLSVARSIVSNLDDWDQLFECSGIDELY